MNEAYLRLVDSSRVRWQNRAHFFAIAAQLMRRILVDFTRRRRYQKRGGHCLHITLAEGVDIATNVNVDLVAVDDALQELSKLDARKAQVVELRFFGGMTWRRRPKRYTFQRTRSAEAGESSQGVVDA